MTAGIGTTGRCLIAAIGLLIPAPTGNGPPPVETAFNMVVEDGELTTRGHTDHPLREDIVALVSTLRSGQAAVTAASIEVTGIASAHGGWTAALRAFAERLPADRNLTVDVVVIDDALALDELCARMFAELADTPIEFRQASSVLRSSSHAALDRIVEFARNCRRGTLEITGHTDGVGGAELNRELSRRRAAAVAAYLQAAGVPARRLRIVGKGATEPVADNQTIGGRARNRRIEIRLLNTSPP